MDDARRAAAANSEQETPKKRRRGRKPVPSAEEGLKLSYETAGKMVAIGVPNRSELFKTPQDPHVVPAPPKSLNSIVPPSGSSDNANTMGTMTRPRPMFLGGQFGYYAGNTGGYGQPVGNAGFIQSPNQQQMASNAQAGSGQAGNGQASIGQAGIGQAGIGQADIGQAGHNAQATGQSSAVDNNPEPPDACEYDLDESSPEEPDDPTDGTYGSARRKRPAAKRPAAKRARR